MTLARLGLPDPDVPVVGHSDGTWRDLRDATRPQPRGSMVSAVLGKFGDVVPAEAGTLRVATGTHRGNHHDQTREILGPVVDRVTAVKHDSRVAALAWCGEVGAVVPVHRNRCEMLVCHRITTT